VFEGARDKYLTVHFKRDGGSCVIGTERFENGNDEEAGDEVGSEIGVATAFDGDNNDGRSITLVDEDISILRRDTLWLELRRSCLARRKVRLVGPRLGVVVVMDVLDGDRVFGEGTLNILA